MQTVIPLMADQKLSQNTARHSERSEESFFLTGQTLRFAQGDSFEIISKNYQNQNTTGNIDYQEGEKEFTSFCEFRRRWPRFFPAGIYKKASGQIPHRRLYEGLYENANARQAVQPLGHYCTASYTHQNASWS